MMYLIKQKGGTAKERLGASIKRHGAIQMLLGLGCLIVGVVSIGIDRKQFDIPVREVLEGGRVINGTSFDIKNVVLGLDAGAVVSAFWVLITGAVPAYMARNTDYNLIKTKVVFMVFSIMAASLFVPIITGAAIATYVLRKSHMGLTVALGVMSLLEFIVAIQSSVYCCSSPWAACKMEKRDKEKKDMENEIYEKQMSKEQLPEYTP
ncbi:uncharacterized protein LOC127719821 [Mytilus californianus]|uniref:uncharacterized protein LOC127719821 n=1 Tax=Mytilus californianus TaxID=6549 RepID=UPI00224658E2|nr:uncharacterized protein LOC127719821 [Mytilus californianus]